MQQKQDPASTATHHISEVANSFFRSISSFENKVFSFFNFKKLNKIFLVGFGLRASYFLLDEGVARALALESLRHGDRFFRYIPTFFFGADPATRVAGTGSCEGFHILLSGIAKDCDSPSRGYYYVFKDSGMTKAIGGSLFFGLIEKFFRPRFHAVLSGIGGTFSPTAGPISSYMRRLIGVMDGLVTPTLKFRFTKRELEKLEKLGRLENDPAYGGMAYRTVQRIRASHLGISGSLIQLFKDRAGVWEGICQNPLSVAVGLGLIGAAVYIGKKTYEYSQEKET